MPTAYELERQANIERNRALLEELDLKDAVSQLGIPPKQEPAKAKAKPIQPAGRKVAKRAVEPTEPRRSSARLRRGAVDPNETPAQKRKREKEDEERRAKEEEERMLAEEEARVAKRPRHHDLDLIELAGDAGYGNRVESLRTMLTEVTDWVRPRAVGDRSAYVFDNDDDDDDDAAREDTELADLKRRMQALRVVSRAKVTQDRVYSCAYHPEPTKDLVFFGDKHGMLGIWDARAPADEVDDDDESDDRPPEEREGGKYWRLQVHWPATSKSSISSIKLDPVDSHSLYTASYDCTIRHLSFVSGISREIFSNDDTLISSIDLAPGGHEMWIADAAGGATHLDLREDTSRARWYGLSTEKIGCLSINPVTPHLVLTASNSRMLRIWDVRKLQGITGKVDSSATLKSAPSSPAGKKGNAPPSQSSQQKPLEFGADVVEEYAASKKGKGLLRGEWKHHKSVSAAYWDPHGRRVVSTSYDDTLRLWDYTPKVLDDEKPLPSSRPFKEIKHNCQTGKWLTILRAQWTPNPDVYPHFTVGNMNHALDVFSCKGELIARLSDKAKITAVQAVTASHPNVVERAVSGNASGRCVLWAPADEE